MAPRFTSDGIENVQRVVAKAVESPIPGLAWLLSVGGEVHRGAAGVASLDDHSPMPVDNVFRIASLTKPLTAVTALIAAERGVFGLDDPISRWLPELADREVLRSQSGPVTDTVPAQRPITIRDLLTFTAGYGYDFAHTEQQTQIGEFSRLGLGVGFPAPATVPAPDQWTRRLSTVPLDHQPGAAWRYHFGSEILGVLLARAHDEQLDSLMTRTVLDPLGMADTRFSAGARMLPRLTTAYDTDPETGERMVYDDPSGQWAQLPAFPSGGGGLLSTIDDFWAFARMLMSGGAGPDGRLLPESSIAAMTADQLPPHLSITDSGDLGWGFGVDVQRRTGDGPRSRGSYGWTGGLGTTWRNDPATGLISVLFTNQTVNSPGVLAVMDDFSQAAYDALA